MTSIPTRYEIPQTEHAKIGWDPRPRPGRAKPEQTKSEIPSSDLTHRPGRAL